MKYYDRNISGAPQSAVWIKEEYLFTPDCFRCSACGKRFSDQADECPGCGARMTGIKKDPVWIDEIVFIEETGILKDPGDGKI